MKNRNFSLKNEKNILCNYINSHKHFVINEYLKCEEINKIVTNVEDKKTFAREHTVNLAMRIMDLTENLPLSLAYFYHHLPNKMINEMIIPETPNLKSEVQNILKNYHELRKIPDYYETTELSDALVKMLSNRNEFFLMVLDNWSKLVLSTKMKLNVNQTELAKSLLEFYSPIIHTMGYHKLDLAICDTAFGVLKPTEDKLIKSYLLCNQEGKGEKNIKKQLNSLVRFIENLLLKFLKKNNLEGFVTVRLKSIYSIYQKLMKYGIHVEKDMKKTDKFWEINDLIAARIVLTEKDDNILSVGKTSHLLRNEPYIKLADPNHILSGINYKNYYRMHNKPYNTIQFTVDLAAIIDWYNNNINPIHQLLHRFTHCDMFANLRINNMEIQIRDEKNHIECEIGKANHGLMKARVTGRSIDNTMLNFMDSIEHKKKERHEITKKIAIIIIDEDRKGNTKIRKNPLPHEETFNKPYLEEKIRLSLKELYNGYGCTIENVNINENKYSNIEKYDVCLIKVYVTLLPNNKLNVKRIEIKPQQE